MKVTMKQPESNSLANSYQAGNCPIGRQRSSVAAANRPGRSDLLRCTIGLLVVSCFALAGCKPFNSPRRPIGVHNLPPAQMMMHPGPGVGGPGPGVLMRQASPAIPFGGEFGMGGAAPESQIAFTAPSEMSITWDVTGSSLFDSEPLIVPGRQNFPQGAIYRLKLTNIPGRPGVELYPTLEVGTATPRTDAYLQHTPIPVEFTPEDFDQVQSGNFVTKVIYLPDPEFQTAAIAPVETLVSTRLAPGVDPIVEADRQGSILAIVRIGNKDLELPGAEEVSGELTGELANEVVPASYVEGASNAVPMAYGGKAASHDAAMSYAAMGGGPVGMPTSAFAPVAYPPNYVSSVTTPQWGMPMSGTPIGLPGPPHVPLGVPAGLQKHIVKNHTHFRMPEPTKKMRIDVKQRPGFSYPKPVSHVWISERIKAPFGLIWNPWANKKKTVVQESGLGYGQAWGQEACPPENY